MIRLYIFLFLSFTSISCNESRNTKASRHAEKNAIKTKPSIAVGERNDTAHSLSNATIEEDKFIEGALYPFDKVFILNW